MARSALMSSWLAEVVLISYREAKQAKTKGYPLPLPLPSEYLSTFIFWGALGLIPEESNLPGMIGWGMVVATFLRLFDPTTGLVVGTVAGYHWQGPTPASQGSTAPGATAPGAATVIGNQIGAGTAKTVGTAVGGAGQTVKTGIGNLF